MNINIFRGIEETMKAGNEALEKEIKLQTLTGYTIDVLIDLFAKGYTLEPPRTILGQTLLEELKKRKDREMNNQEYQIQRLKQKSMVDIYFEKIHYEKMLEVNQDKIKIIYTSRYKNHRHSQNRAIEFSNESSINIRQRDDCGLFLSREEIICILLKMEELEKIGWSFN